MPVRKVTKKEIRIQKQIEKENKLAKEQQMGAAVMKRWLVGKKTNTKTPTISTTETHAAEEVSDPESGTQAEAGVCDERGLACDNKVEQPIETQACDRVCDKRCDAETASRAQADEWVCDSDEGECDNQAGQVCDSDVAQNEWACDGMDVERAEAWKCDEKYGYLVKMDIADERACDKEGLARLIGSLEVVRIGKRNRKGNYKYVPFKQQNEAQEKKTDDIQWVGQPNEDGQKEKEKKVPGERIGEKSEIENERKGESKGEERGWERDKSKLNLPKSKTTTENQIKLSRKMMHF